MAFISSRTAHRGKWSKTVTTSTAEVEVLVIEQGSTATKGFSVIVTGTGAGTIKVYYYDPEGIVVTDTVFSEAKTSGQLVALNYQGLMPKVSITILPSGTSSMTWMVEAGGLP